MQTWVFIGTQLSQATDTSFYQLNPVSPPADCNEGTALPCQLVIDDDAIDTKEALHDYFISELSNDPNQVLANSATRRPLP